MPYLDYTQSFYDREHRAQLYEIQSQAELFFFEYITLIV